eukprot:GHRR01025646.1.p3 GENE.GHRR01025646.1~~GHRR01025646.1.p3  ORF type:complete len:107 (+),score=28.38 GHRR01025646.1:185-505(+)
MGWQCYTQVCIVYLHFLQVWDLKTGQLLRTQTAHKGMVTCLAYASSAKLLFLGSMDSSIGVWTEKGSLLQETLSSRQLSNNQQLFAMQLGHSRATPGHTQVHGTLD